ncbi:DUF2809 domain-containing protein [Nonomuraea sp. NPDC050556]|uniref:DUF2809 domain-containing protein n=1 Tax=Nonomuraea sp. NPDC050556 TaxID=3364369 RepID=UPI0037A1F575
MPRLITALAALLTVGAGLGVRALLDGPFAKYAGDALYTVLIYLIIVFVGPKLRPLTAALLATAVSWAVEFAQLADLPEVVRPVLGSTFNPPDLFWYAVGAACIAVLHTLVGPIRLGSHENHRDPSGPA